MYLRKTKHQLKTQLLTKEILVKNQKSIKFCPGSLKNGRKLKLNMCDSPSFLETPQKNKLKMHKSTRTKKTQEKTTGDEEVNKILEAERQIDEWWLIKYGEIRKLSVYDGGGEWIEAKKLKRPKPNHTRELQKV